MLINLAQNGGYNQYRNNLIFNSDDKKILQTLGGKIHLLAQEEKNNQFLKLWTDTNDLKMTKPPIYINEICWNEFSQLEELQLHCKHPLAREMEESLRRLIFCTDNKLGNIIVEDYIEIPLVIYDSDFGIDEQVDIVKTDESSEVVSRHFNLLISTMDDIEKIKMPEIYIDHELSHQFEVLYHDIFDNIISVRVAGSRGLWFTPWDYLIRVTGIEDTMYNMYDEPEFVESCVKRYVDCAMERMRKYKELGIWASNNTPIRVGSGGYGCISSLESPNGNDLNCDTKQMWGCSNAQIFSDVSPDMHWQFALKYDMPWLEQFGCNYYGCCEPLHNKIDILKKIPNLRKVSMSPWNDFKLAAERIGKDYVMSCKPSPAIFVNSKLDEAEARKQIDTILEATKGCNLELIMKDISTVSHNPMQLIRWAEIAQQAIDEFYN